MWAPAPGPISSMAQVAERADNLPLCILISAQENRQWSQLKRANPLLQWPQRLTSSYDIHCDQIQSCAAFRSCIRCAAPIKGFKQVHVRGQKTVDSSWISAADSQRHVEAGKVIDHDCSRRVGQEMETCPKLLQIVERIQIPVNGQHCNTVAFLGAIVQQQCFWHHADTPWVCAEGSAAGSCMAFRSLKLDGANGSARLHLM